MLHGVALVGHAQPGQAARPGELEGMADDALDALPGVDLLLNRHFVLGARLEAAADAGVEPLGVLPEHHEVDVGRAAPLQRAQPLVQQRDRPVVDVQIELEAGAQQDVAGMTVVGNPWVAERADEDGVEPLQEVDSRPVGIVTPVAR